MMKQYSFVKVRSGITVGMDRISCWQIQESQKVPENSDRKLGYQIDAMLRQAEQVKSCDVRIRKWVYKREPITRSTPRLILVDDEREYASEFKKIGDFLFIEGIKLNFAEEQ